MMYRLIAGAHEAPPKDSKDSSSSISNREPFSDSSVVDVDNDNFDADSGLLLRGSSLEWTVIPEVDEVQYGIDTHHGNFHYYAEPDSDCTASSDEVLSHAEGTHTAELKKSNSTLGQPARPSQSARKSVAAMRKSLHHVDPNKVHQEKVYCT